MQNYFQIIHQIINQSEAEFVVELQKECAVYAGHFPGNPIMPGVLLVEAMAQVGGISVLIAEEHRGKLPVFAKIDNCRFRRQVVPGDQFVTTAEVVKIVRDKIVIIKLVGTVNGEIAAEAEGTFSLMPGK